MTDTLKRGQEERLVAQVCKPKQVPETISQNFSGFFFYIPKLAISQSNMSLKNSPPTPIWHTTTTRVREVSKPIKTRLLHVTWLYGGMSLP